MLRFKQDYGNLFPIGMAVNSDLSTERFQALINALEALAQESFACDLWVEGNSMARLARHALGNLQRIALSEGRA